MKQTVFHSANLTAQGTQSRVYNEVEWQGGDGWLSVINFNQVSGSPRIDIAEIPFQGASPVPSPDLPSSITASGVYPFSAPKGAIITFEVVVDPGENLSFSTICLLGNA